MRTVAHLYDSYEHAQTVVNELESAGFTHENVSLVANQGATSTYNSTATTGTLTGDMAPAAMPGDVPVTTAQPEAAGAGAGTGASIGTIIGGGAGLLAGIGALAIPGVGPVVAAGWLIATLTGAGAGAAAGGLLGSLTGAGVSEEHAHVYAEGVRRGSTLVTVRAEDGRVAEAEAIMARYNPVDVDARGTDYRNDAGWERFDETRAGLTPEELAAERARYVTTGTTDGFTTPGAAGRLDTPSGGV